MLNRRSASNYDETPWSIRGQRRKDGMLVVDTNGEVVSYDVDG